MAFGGSVGKVCLPDGYRYIPESTLQRQLAGHFTPEERRDFTPIAPTA